MLTQDGMKSLSIPHKQPAGFEIFLHHTLRSLSYRQKDREHLDITCRDFHNSRTESELKATWRQEPPLHKNSERDVSSSVTTPFMLRFLEAMHPVTVLEHWRFFFPSSSPEHSKSVPDPSPWTSQAASRTHFKKPSKSFLLWFLDII